MGGVKLADWLAKRQLQNKNLEEQADALGVSPVTVWRAKRGMRLSVSTMDKIVKATSGKVQYVDLIGEMGR